MGYPMRYDDRAQIMDEIAATTPTFAGVSFDLLDEVGSVQWPCNDEAPGRHADHARRRRSSAARAGSSRRRTCRPTSAARRKYPLILTTGRILSQYNVGAQTRRTANVAWHAEDMLEIHPHDAEDRGHRRRRRWSRWPAGSARRRCTRSCPTGCPSGVVYTTFHHPVSGANVVTTENSDWATNCPEYKVTAVQVGLLPREPAPAAGALGSREPRSCRRAG